MSETHALVTGPTIIGRIPHGEGFLDVTPDVLYFDTHAEALAAADSIEVEHHVRGTHPIQLECQALDDPEQYPNGISDEHRAAHRAAHRELNARMGS
jgi:hypothetical protein